MVDIGSFFGVFAALVFVFDGGEVGGFYYGGESVLGFGWGRRGS